MAFAINPLEFAGVLAAAFYDHPSEKMLTVGVTGTNGKTTVAWLMRSVFEHLGLLTGLTGTVEYALEKDRVTGSGDLWVPDRDDPTLERESSTPFWTAPYEGKYDVACTTPDAIQVGVGGWKGWGVMCERSKRRSAHPQLASLNPQLPTPGPCRCSASCGGCTRAVRRRS